MITAQQAFEIEERLTTLLDTDVEAIRDYLAGSIGAGVARRTGIKFVRGTHSGSYVRDPEGHDVLPVGYEAPPLTRK